MNPMEFILAIIVITTIGGIMKARMGGGGRLRRRERFVDDDDDDAGYRDSAESVRLKEEVRMLKERIQTLERIVTDRPTALAREIDSLGLADQAKPKKDMA